MDRNNPAINLILEETADLVGRCKETAGNVEPTEGYKGRQIERLKTICHYPSFMDKPTHIIINLP